MRNSVEIPYNRDYGNGLYPRQKKKLKRLVREMKVRGIHPNLTGIEIAGEDNLAVIDNIAGQIIDKIGDVCDRQLVLFFGDGGNIVFNSALLANLGNDELEHAVVVADGGTMANLSNTLNTADPAIAAGVVSGEMPFWVENLRLREAVITIYDKGGDATHTVTYPWTCSVGTKISGDIINSWEKHPRSRNPILNLALSIWQVMQDTVRKHGNGQPIQGDSITTLQNIGFFKFDERYTDLEGDTFHRQSFESEFGWAAMKRIAVFTAISHIPALSRWVWTKIPKDAVSCSDILQMAAEIEPQPVSNPILEADHIYPNIHLDGFPVQLGELGLEEGGRAEIELRSTDKSIPVVRVSH